VTVAAGTETWASTLATATAVPSVSPVQPAARSVSPPARSPTKLMRRDTFSSTTRSNRGSSAAKYALGGKPSCLDQIALHPAVQLFRVSAPVSCHST
jgi:hypothetical protein